MDFLAMKERVSFCGRTRLVNVCISSCVSVWVWVCVYLYLYQYLYSPQEKRFVSGQSTVLTNARTRTHFASCVFVRPRLQERPGLVHVLTSGFSSFIPVQRPRGLRTRRQEPQEETPAKGNSVVTSCMLQTSKSWHCDSCVFQEISSASDTRSSQISECSSGKSVKLTCEITNCKSLHLHRWILNYWSCLVVSSLRDENHSRIVFSFWKIWEKEALLWDTRRFLNTLYIASIPP